MFFHSSALFKGLSEREDFTRCWCEQKTSHVHFLNMDLFKQCEPLQGILIQIKVNKFGALATSELVSRHTERQAQQCLK